MRRLFIVSVLLSLLPASIATAQTRWVLSVGPEWTATNGGYFFGGRLRGEYDLISPESPFRLRAEVGGYWEPTQSYNGRLIDGTTLGGQNQTADIAFGLAAAITPVPKARVAPYLTLGVLARQMWRHGWGSQRSPDGAYSFHERSRTLGGIIIPVGVGIRARIAGRMFQVEMRTFDYARNSVTLGTNLPF